MILVRKLLIQNLVKLMMNANQFSTRINQAITKLSQHIIYSNFQDQLLTNQCDRAYRLTSKQSSENANF
jgi:hypothetical protein